MDSTNIDRIIGFNQDLKSLPESVHQLNLVMKNKNVTMSEISEIVSSDPVLSAKILKTVNSPFYGFPSRIDTIAYAISILGMDSIHYLAISNAVIGKFSSSSNKMIPRETFWRHSFTTASVAKQLAHMVGHKDPERLFTSGLLHELGSLLLAIAIPEQYRDVIANANVSSIPMYQSERDMLGFTHMDITAQLLKHWSLPESVHESVRNMYELDKAGKWLVDASILNIADSLAASTCPSIRVANLELKILPAAWGSAGVKPYQLTSVLDELDTLVDSAMQGLYFENAA